MTPAGSPWHCFGSGIGGGSLDWVTKTNGVSFRQAAELLREGMPPEDSSLAAAVVKQSTVRKLPVPVALDGA